jgi:hypothetical protein
MPLPDTAVFNDLLSSFTLREPECLEGFLFRTCLAAEQVNDQGLVITLPGIVVWWSASANQGISAEALVRKIHDLLLQQDLMLDTEAVWCLIAIFASSKRKSKEGAVIQFNKIFECIKSADLNQYVIQHSIIDPKWNMTIEDFIVGPINKEQIQYRSRRAGSDFAERYLDMYPDFASTVSRSPRRVKMIDQLALDEGWGGINDLSRFARLFNRMVGPVSQHYFTEFDQEFESGQELMTAMGAGFFENKVQLNDFHQWTWLSIFLMVEGKMKGWVYPGVIGGRTYSYGRPDLAITHAKRVWQEDFGLEGVKNHSAMVSMKSYCHFLHLAQIHQRHERHNEAFLHLIIALDLLLGSKESATESVSKRTAILVFLGLNQEFTATVKLIKTLYDARSRYVHAGQKIDAKLWDESNNVCREIAIAYLAAMVSQGDEFTHQKWVKLLDLLIAQQDLGVALSADVLASAGISRKQRFERFDQGFSNVEGLAHEEELERILK